MVAFCYIDIQFVKCLEFCEPFISLNALHNHMLGAGLDCFKQFQIYFTIIIKLPRGTYEMLGCNHKPG